MGWSSLSYVMCALSMDTFIGNAGWVLQYSDGDSGLRWDKHVPVDVAILDFSKAFDVVPDRRLLRKLSLYGTKWSHPTHGNYWNLK